MAVGGAVLMSLKGPRTRLIDLEGSGVLPGFNDAHAHVVYYGLTRFGADLGGARSVAEIADRLRTHGRTLARGEWAEGGGDRHPLEDAGTDARWGGGAEGLGLRRRRAGRAPPAASPRAGPCNGP